MKQAKALASNGSQSVSKPKGGGGDGDAVPVRNGKLREVVDEEVVVESPKQAFDRIYKTAMDMGLTGTDLDVLESIQFLKVPKSNLRSFYFISSVIALIVLAVGVVCSDWPVSTKKVVESYLKVWDADLEFEKCIKYTPDIFIDWFRPVQNCSVCQGITEVDHVTKISPSDFEKLYAYSSKPVIIVDGAMNWTAPRTFGYNWFKDLYNEHDALQDHGETPDCQFFPYKTEFNALIDVFEMSAERSATPWYIGWSNCHPAISAELRRHYDRPYFLPKLSESSKTDWIFMGSPGYGAHMHVDNVELSSWQAQITGRKKWILEPPRECSYACKKRIEVIVEPGEIIVLNTNVWYHSTLVMGDEMSITIGSEYD